jgi:hypothetical protein
VALVTITTTCHIHDLPYLPLFSEFKCSDSQSRAPVKPATATWVQNNASSWYNDPNWRRMRITRTRASTHTLRAREEVRKSECGNGGRRGRQREPIHTWDEKDLFTLETRRTYSHLRELKSASLSQFDLSLAFVVCHVGCWRS